MKTFFVSLFFTFMVVSCVENPAKDSDKVKKNGVSKITNQKEKDCDSGEEVLKKIEVKKDTLSLSNLESGCSINKNEADDLKL